MLADGGNIDNVVIDQITTLRARMATSIETGAARLHGVEFDALPVSRAELLDELRHPQHDERATAAMYWLSTLYRAGGRR